jgi:hypothetical protein
LTIAGETPKMPALVPGSAMDALTRQAGREGRRVQIILQIFVFHIDKVVKKGYLAAKI